MRLSTREKLRQSKQASQSFDSVEGMVETMLGGPMLPTQQAFIFDDAENRAYMGAAGVAKTSTLAASGLLRCLFHPGYHLLVARFDYNDLKDTTLQRFEDQLHRLPKGILLDRNKEAPQKWWLRPFVGDGTEVSEITFSGLKEYMGSYEFHGAVVDEADELDERTLMSIRTRLRKPGSDLYEFMIAFNPPDKTHFLYEKCTGLDRRDRPKSKPVFKLFVPVEGENNKNLPKDYYKTISAGLPPDMVDRLVKGKWGVILDGDAVFREFSTALHTAESVPWVKGRELIRCWDFGFRRPACVWESFDDAGQLQVHRELLGDNEEIGVFIQKVNAVTAQEFKGFRAIHDFGDPAAKQQKDTGSTLSILYKAGIQLLYKVTRIEEGLRTMRMMMSTLHNGRVPFIIDSTNCPILVRAMQGGYRLDKTGQKPLKDGFYDHLADAWRYGNVNLFAPDGTLAMSVVAREHRQDDVTTLGYGHLPDSLEYSRSEDVSDGTSAQQEDY